MNDYSIVINLSEPQEVDTRKNYYVKVVEPTNQINKNTAKHKPNKNLELNTNNNNEILNNLDYLVTNEIQKGESFENIWKKAYYHTYINQNK